MQRLFSNFFSFAVILSLSVLSILSTGVLTPVDAQAANFGGLTDNGTAAYMGIGIATAVRPLHLFGNVALFQRNQDSAGFIIQRTDSNRWVLGVNESPDLGNGFVLSTYPLGDISSTARLLVTPTGNVGIGTKSPSRKLQVETSSGEAVYGQNTISTNYGSLGGSTEGVHGHSPDSQGVYGDSSTGDGVYGSSGSGTGVRGSGGLLGVEGRTNSSGTGVFGYSGTGVATYGAGAGVSGQGTSYGVYGDSSSGYGVYGRSSIGYAGYFDGNVNVTGNLYTHGDNVTGGITGGIRHYQWMGAINFDGNIYSNDWADIKAYPGSEFTQRTFGLHCKHDHGCTYVRYLDGVRKADTLGQGGTENITMSGNLSDARILLGKTSYGWGMLQVDVLDANASYMQFIIHDGALPDE